MALSHVLYVVFFVVMDANKKAARIVDLSLSVGTVKTPFDTRSIYQRPLN